jgi:hypothetical protein
MVLDRTYIFVDCYLNHFLLDESYIMSAFENGNHFARFFVFHVTYKITNLYLICTA